jgi:hypothetical protein
VGPELGFDPASGPDVFSAAGRGSCALRVPVDNFDSCSFKCARAADVRFAAAAVVVALLRLFEAVTFRLAALARRFAAPDSWAAVLTLELVRVRFESFVAVVFALERLVLLVLRAA